MKPVIFHPEAQAELDAAVAYHEARRPGLGLDLQAEVERVVQFIQQHSGSGTLIPPHGARRRSVRKFSYNVVYLEQDGVIEIIAVAHQKRKPGYWARRLP
jgi:plasmid stabilization system protein ParE